MGEQSDGSSQTVRPTTTTACEQDAHMTLQDAEQRLLDDLAGYGPADELPNSVMSTVVRFGHACARYLLGDCQLAAAREAWEAYRSAMSEYVRQPLKEYKPGSSRHPPFPSPPDMLARFGRALTADTAPLDEFSRRVVDLCLVTEYHMESFLLEIKTQGPIAATYAYLRAGGMDEETALAALLSTFAKLTESPDSLLTKADFLAGAVPLAPLIPPNALGRFLLTLVPEHLPLIVRLLTSVKKSPQFVKAGLTELIVLLGSDPTYLPLAWRLAREAPPLLAGACAGALLLIDPEGMDADLCAQTTLRLGARNQRLAACQALIGAECSVTDDLQMMRSFLRRPFAENPMDLTITAWLSRSKPMVWWAPVLSATADEQALNLMGKGARVAFWRELGREARRQGARVQFGSGGPTRAFSRSAFLLAWRLEAQRAFARAGAPLGLSASALYELLAQR